VRIPGAGPDYFLVIDQSVLEVDELEGLGDSVKCLGVTDIEIAARAE
jgi:hypothetical protein